MADAMTREDARYMRPILYGLRASSERLLVAVNLRRKGHNLRIPLRTHKAWIRAFERLHHADYWKRERFMRDDTLPMINPRNEPWAKFWSACHGLYQYGFQETIHPHQFQAHLRDLARADTGYKRPEVSRPFAQGLREALRRVRGRRI